MRIRHQLEVRLATVLRVEPLSHGIVRIGFAAEALKRFASASFDDHVQLLLPPSSGVTIGQPVRSMAGDAVPPRRLLSVGRIGTL